MRVRLTFAKVDGPRVPPHFPREAVAAPGEPVTVGRSPAATLCVPDDAALAPQHALVVCYDDGCRVFDVAGRGLVVDGAPTFEALLRDGSIVEAGGTVVRVAALPPDAPDGDSAAARAATVVAAITEPLAADRAAALAHVRAAEARLYAVLDGARQGAAVAAARASGELLAPLPDDGEALGYLEAAPWLVRLPPESPLVERLFRVAWGTAECVFLSSARPFAELRAFLRGLFFHGPGYIRPLRRRPPDQREGDPETPTFFRFYDPVVLADLYATPGVDVRPLFGRGMVLAWYCEAYDDAAAELPAGDTPGADARNSWDEPDDPDAWADDAARVDLPPATALVEFRASSDSVAGWRSWTVQ